jgi:hypothetical protein
MSYISQKHRQISIWLNDVGVLTNPEDYFGPNYKTLLNYWIYYESTLEEQRNEYWKKIWDLDGATWERHLNLGFTLALQVCELLANNMNSIEREICAAHLILEQGENLVFLPLLVDACSSVTSA